MYRESLTAEIAAEHPYSVTYFLTEEQGAFGVECVANGREALGTLGRSAVRGITENRKDAERFLYLLAKGAVCPANMPDVAEDFFGL